jgi:hypothetical protein
MSVGRTVHIPLVRVVDRLPVGEFPCPGIAAVYEVLVLVLRVCPAFLLDVLEVHRACAVRCAVRNVCARAAILLAVDALDLICIALGRPV